jgi:hypothetical protein
VVWDLDWERFDASGGRARKLSVTDTGTGMTAGQQLRYYINQLAASGRAQSLSGNFGVGAKMAAGSPNPHGLGIPLVAAGRRLAGVLQARSRRALGAGTAAVGSRPRRFLAAAGRGREALAAAQLRSRHQLVLLGLDERHDTTEAPQSVTEAGRQWMTRYLNGRSVRLPTRVEVLVREDPGRGEPEQLRRIHCERHNLDRRALAPGAGQLSDALAHWWVLDGDHRARRRETVLWASTERAADRARQLARELELRFAQDTKLACKLNDAHDRSNRANDRLWRRMHPNGIAAVYGERPTAGSAAFAKNRSEALGAPTRYKPSSRSTGRSTKRTATTSASRRIAADSGPKSAKSSAPFSTSSWRLAGLRPRHATRISAGSPAHTRRRSDGGPRQRIFLRDPGPSRDREQRLELWLEHVMAIRAGHGEAS